jgi:hypothetical protein
VLPFTYVPVDIFGNIFPSLLNACFGKAVSFVVHGRFPSICGINDCIEVLMSFNFANLNFPNVPHHDSLPYKIPEIFMVMKNWS